VDEIGAKVETSPSKSWTNLYNRCDDITTTTNATKLQHFHPYKTNMIHKTYTADTDAELNFKNCYPELRVGRRGGGDILQKLTQLPYLFNMELGSIPVH